MREREREREGQRGRASEKDRTLIITPNYTPPIRASVVLGQLLAISRIAFDLQSTLSLCTKLRYDLGMQTANSHGDAASFLTVGSFLLTAALFCFQLCLGAFLLTD